MKLSCQSTMLFFSVATLVTTASADPLPGEVQKFQQLPMVTTQIDGIVYNGHDEVSTLYGVPVNGQPGGPVLDYQGTAMADDFADPFASPVVHIRWWGSYLGNLVNPANPIDKFLIAFESDLPASQNPLGFSRPDQVLSTQIVNRGTLSSGSGTFTEKLLFTAPPGGEDIYEYNAELHLGQEFFQLPATVYWLKIAALVEPSTDYDVDGDIDLSDLAVGLAQGQIPQWGWHNRDYTAPDPHALAVTPPVSPGEHDAALLNGLPYPTPVWHFQDDAVSNGGTHLQMDPTTPGVPANLIQPPFNYQPTRYVDGLDGPGPGVLPNGLPHVGIGQFSQDLAFELYTVPEPTSVALLALSGLGVLVGRNRSAGSRSGA